MFLFSCSFFLLFQFFHSAGNDLFKIQLAGKLRLKPYGYVSKKKFCRFKTSSYLCEKFRCENFRNHKVLTI